jgi:hypothetical protein
MHAAAGAGHEHARVVAVDADFGLHALEKFERLLRLLGFVALVVLPENLSVAASTTTAFTVVEPTSRPTRNLRV